MFIRENVAVAVSYGYSNNRTREFENKPETVLFVDMGCKYTTATLVDYKQVGVESRVKGRTPGGC